MDINSLPQIIMILLALVLILFILSKLLNIDVLGNISSMIIGLARNIFASVSF